MDLGLTQLATAALLRVSNTSLRHWEEGVCEPLVAQRPAILEFLGYRPKDRAPQSLGERLRQTRETRGLSRKALARVLDAPPTPSAPISTPAGSVGGAGVSAGPGDALLAFVAGQFESWITKLKETQARNGQELDTRVEKIGQLVGKVFGADSGERREFRRAVEINAEPT